LKLLNNYRRYGSIRSRRASSRKTRIETLDKAAVAEWEGVVEERVPGKQGLKLDTPPSMGTLVAKSKSEFQENKD